MSDALLTSFDLTELYQTACRPSTCAPSHDYGVGRVGDCGHTLCRYNPGPNCWPCGDPPETEKPPWKLAPPVEVTCRECGAVFYSSGHNARYCTAQCRHVAWVARRRAQVAT